VKGGEPQLYTKTTQRKEENIPKKKQRSGRERRGWRSHQSGGGKKSSASPPPFRKKIADEKRGQFYEKKEGRCGDGFQPGDQNGRNEQNKRSTEGSGAERLTKGEPATRKAGRDAKGSGPAALQPWGKKMLQPRKQPGQKRGKNGDLSRALW